MRIVFSDGPDSRESPCLGGKGVIASGSLFFHVRRTPAATDMRKLSQFDGDQVVVPGKTSKHQPRGGWYLAREYRQAPHLGTDIQRMAGERRRCLRPLFEEHAPRFGRILPPHP